MPRPQKEVLLYSAQRNGCLHLELEKLIACVSEAAIADQEIHGFTVLFRLADGLREFQRSRVGSYTLSEDDCGALAQVAFVKSACYKYKCAACGRDYEPSTLVARKQFLPDWVCPEGHVVYSPADRIIR